MRKRFFSILLIYCMVVLMIPTEVAAAEDTDSSSDLSANAIVEAEVNDTVDCANEALANTEITGSIPKSSDVDWFVVQIPNDGHISLTLDHDYVDNPDVALKMTIYTSDNECLADWIQHVNTTSTKTGDQTGIPAGTYYLRILLRNLYDPYSSVSPANYHFTVDYTPSDFWEKELNETIATANWISTGTWINGSSRNNNSDVDWYRFEMPTDGRISIILYHDFNSYDEAKWNTVLYTASNKALAGWTWIHSINGAYTESGKAEVNVPAGIYYLRISRGEAHDHKSYSFRIDHSATSYFIETSAKPEQGGTVTGSGRYEKGKTVTVEAVANYGYTFVEWQENDSMVSTNASYTFTAGADQSLTAVFEREQTSYYYVTYNANGGSGAPAAQTKTQNQSLTLSSTRPTRSGYTFAGWATSSNGSVQYQPGGTYTGNANLILYAVWTPVSTAGADITVGSGTASPGGTIGIPVSIRNNPGIAGAQFTISYDKSVMTLERIERGSIFSNGNYTGDAGRNLVQWYNTSNSTSNGTMFTLYFKVNQTARSGRYSVGLQYQTDNICDQNKKPVQIKIEEGAVSVAAGQLGDVTGDGRIAINDVVKLAQSVAGYTTLTSQEQALADVTHDGRIAINDVVKLAQYVAGYITSL